MASNLNQLPFIFFYFCHAQKKQHHNEMAELKNQGLDFDSSNLLLFVLRWKKPLIIVTVLSAVLSAIFSAPMFITPKFESTVIMFPTSTASISKSLLAKNNAGKEDLLSFGEEEQAEQLIQNHLRRGVPF